MNINNEPTPFSSYERYYQASANDYPDYPNYEEQNDGLNVVRTDPQSELIYPDGETEQIYKRNVTYDQYQPNVYEKKTCSSCAYPMRCGGYVDKNQEPHFDSVPSTSHSPVTRIRTGKIRRFPKPALKTYDNRQHCQHSESAIHDLGYCQFVSPVVDNEVKADYDAYAQVQPNCQQYDEYNDCRYNSSGYHTTGGAFTGVEGQYNNQQQYKQYRMGHGVVKKFPVTLKMPRYCIKKPAILQVTKKPSVLSLPIATQRDPVPTVARKNRQLAQQVKKQQIFDPADAYTCPDETQNLESITTHQITSHGDVINERLHNVENIMEQMKNNNFLEEKKLVQEPTGEIKKTVKEFSKYFKPKVPSSIRTKQEQVTKMASALNMEATPQTSPPKKKISLEQLLNRLQKCETPCKREGKNIGQIQKKSSSVNKKPIILNYDSISHKIPFCNQQKKSLENIPRASTSLTTSLDRQKSLDDYGALELHKSKSYIVNLIDRALSKELGTIPRERLPDNKMTTKKALESISRHRGPLQKELTYEVTAALTDSIISRATAPPVVRTANDMTQQEETRSEGSVKNKICTCNLDDGYVKQLKQLRWGHIRHIQHEARRLADLEEFLDRIGENEP